MGKQVVAGSNGGLAQLGEHLPCKQGVKSSNLSVSIQAFFREEAHMKACFQICEDEAKSIWIDLRTSNRRLRVRSRYKNACDNKDA